MDGQYSAGSPKKTSRVPQNARWIWDLVIGFSPEAAKSPLDAVMLESLCRWWAKWDAYDRRLDETIPGDKEEYKVAMLAVAAWKQCDKIASRFGLSMADRARLKVAPSKPKDDSDPLDALKLVGAKAS
jgi:glucose-6-phosphate 1-dehydrogenase